MKYKEDSMPEQETKQIDGKTFYKGEKVNLWYEKKKNVQGVELKRYEGDTLWQTPTKEKEENKNG